MSGDKVLLLARENVFLPRTRWFELATDHVPIDSLEGRRGWEDRALAAIVRNQPVSVIGSIGSGKSSLIAYVCAQLPATHVAFRLPITGADDPTDGSTVASVAIGQALHAIEFEAYQQEALEQARATENAIEKRERGVPAVVLEEAAFRSRSTSSFNRCVRNTRPRCSQADRLAGLDRLIGILATGGLQPVFVCDDTEAMVGTADATDTVEAFFNGPVRAFLTEVEASLVIGVQTNIATASPTFRDLRTRTAVVTIDGFTDPHAALRTIASRRLVEAETGFAVDDVMHGDALDALVSFYGESGNSLRYTLAVLNGSAGHAADMASERICAAHIQKAAHEWRDQRR